MSDVAMTDLKLTDDTTTAIAETMTVLEETTEKDGMTKRKMGGGTLSGTFVPEEAVKAVAADWVVEKVVVGSLDLRKSFQ